MKQPEDDKTVDLFEVFEVLEKYTPKSEKYMFYIEMEDGSTLEWRGLPLTTAKAMHRATNKNLRTGGVKRYGWEEI